MNARQDLYEQIQEILINTSHPLYDEETAKLLETYFHETVQEQKNYSATIVYSKRDQTDYYQIRQGDDINWADLELTSDADIGIREAIQYKIDQYLENQEAVTYKYTTSQDSVDLTIYDAEDYEIDDFVHSITLQDILTTEQMNAFGLAQDAIVSFVVCRIRIVAASFITYQEFPDEETKAVLTDQLPDNIIEEQYSADVHGAAEEFKTVQKTIEETGNFFQSANPQVIMVVAVYELLQQQILEIENRISQLN